jgi:hypothetical protein
MSPVRTKIEWALQPAVYFPSAIEASNIFNFVHIVYLYVVHYYLSKQQLFLQTALSDRSLYGDAHVFGELKNQRLYFLCVILELQSVKLLNYVKKSNDVL